MIAALFVVLVACAAPWAFGAVDPLWWAAAAGACLVAAVLEIARCAAGRDAMRPLPESTTRVAWLLPLVALVGLVPVPLATRGLFAWGSADLVSRAALGSGRTWMPISVDPHGTLDAAIVAAGCAAAFWLVARAARSARMASALASIFVAVGLALVAYGIAVPSDGRTMYGSIVLPDVATPFGPYVNRDHFAGAMLAFAGVAAGGMLAALGERRFLRAAISSATLLAALAGIAATGSRGAELAALAGAAVLVAWTRGAMRLRGALVFLALGALLVAGLAASGLAPNLWRTFHLYGRWKNRFDVQADALRVFAGHPFFGTGAGSFAEAYPPFQTADSSRSFSGAHSDWVQFLMETGLVGVAWAGAALAGAVRAFQTSVRAADPDRWRALGPAAGCVALCVHGLFETNLHVPANALLFAVALGLAAGAAARRLPDALSGTDAPRAS